MSLQAITWATKQKVGKVTGKAILLTLANYADENGDCFPSQKKLAEDCECSLRTITRWLDKFEQNGIIVREKRRGQDGYRTSDSIQLQLDNSSQTDMSCESNGNSYTPATENKQKNQPNKLDAMTARMVLEGVLSPKRASDILEHREKLHKPLSIRAAELLTEKLANSLHSCGLSPDDAADQMILRGWQRFEPEWIIRSKKVFNGQKNGTKSKHCPNGIRRHSGSDVAKQMLEFARQSGLQ